MSAHTFLPFSSSCVLSSFSVSVSLHHLSQPPLPLIFSLSLWHLEASQTTPSWNCVSKHTGNISVIIKPALQLPNTSSVMCAQTRTQAHIHTLPGRVKQPLFSQKIGIKKEQKIPFRLEVEGIIINLSPCDGKMVNTCQNCLLRLQSMPSALLEVLQ